MTRIASLDLSTKALKSLCTQSSLTTPPRWVSTVLIVRKDQEVKYLDPSRKDPDYWE